MTFDLSMWPLMAPQQESSPMNLWPKFGHNWMNGCKVMYINICDGRPTDDIWILSLTSTFGGRGNNQKLLKMFPIETLQQCDSFFSFAHLALNQIF